MNNNLNIVNDELKQVNDKEINELNINELE